MIGLDKRSFQVIQYRRGLIQCQEVTNQTEQFLELLSQTLNFFVPLRCENIIVYIVLIVRGCFDRMQGLNKLLFALDVSVLPLHNYGKLSCTSSCILLICNHMIFLVQFGINKHLQIFSKTTNCTRPTSLCNFVSL